MKDILGYARLLLMSTVVIFVPVMSACKSAPLTAIEQTEHDAALEAGNADAAIYIEQKANERQVEGILSMIAPFIPGGETIKKSASVLLATALFPRPRKHYLNAIKSVGKAAVAANPLGSAVAPGEAVQELWSAVKSIAAAPGLIHSDTVNKREA